MFLGQVDAVQRDRLGGLAAGEGQVGRSQFAQPSRDAQAVQGHRRVDPAGDQQPEVAGHPLHNEILPASGYYI